MVQGVPRLESPVIGTLEMDDQEVPKLEDPAVETFEIEGPIVQEVV